MDKACRVCGDVKPLEAFYKHPKSRDGRDGKCIECAKARTIANRKKRLEYYREYDRQRGKLPHRVKANTERTKMYRKNNPKKWDCHKKLNNALRDGRVTRKPCAVWDSTERIEAHHYDYSKPLEVIWLCSVHHTAVHMA